MKCLFRFWKGREIGTEIDNPRGGQGQGEMDSVCVFSTSQPALNDQILILVAKLNRNQDCFVRQTLY